MDKGTVLNIINNFKAVLAQKGVEVDRVILYGSHANETQREDSDIDVIVISDSFQDMNYWERIDVMADAISDILEPIEAIAMTNSEWENKVYMAAEYARNGVVI